MSFVSGIDPRKLDRLRSIVRLLDDNGAPAGEVSAAAAAGRRVLPALGFANWVEVVERAVAPAPPAPLPPPPARRQPQDTKATITWCLQQPQERHLTPKERSFLVSIREARFPLSEKQVAWLLTIAHKLGTAEHGS